MVRPSFVTQGSYSISMFTVGLRHEWHDWVVDIFTRTAIETAGSWNQQAINDVIEGIRRRMSVATEESLETT